MKSYLFMAALAVSATAASASVIPVLDNASPVDLGNGTFAYTYSATLASQAALATGNYFTLYDFGDFVSVSATPANWSFTTANVGLTPADTLPDDDAAITNITFTYNGPALNYEENGPFSEISFEPFTIISRSGVFGFDSFTSLTTKNQGPTRGTTIGTVGQVEVPLVGGGGGSVVPEPASWAMLIAGFGLVGGNLRRRRQTAVAA